MNGLVDKKLEKLLKTRNSTYHLMVKKNNNTHSISIYVIIDKFKIGLRT